MARILFVTGGARSGKSAYAQRRALELPAPRAYVATCPVIDAEMERRIQRHRASRDPREWTTLEAPLALEEALRSSGSFSVRLVDCLTLWVNNLLFEESRLSQPLDEDNMADRGRGLLQAASGLPGHVIFVTNEVGAGIVPENALARRYRDLTGRLNQTIAAGADEAVLTVSGLPLHLKGA